MSTFSDHRRWSGLPDLTPSDLRIDPLEQSETIPSSWYTDPGFLNLEKLSIFQSAWNHVGHNNRIPNIGDLIVAQIPGSPVVVLRANDSSLRAFFNVCRHRGGPLATGDCNGKMLQCKYHGWTYTLEGQLRGVPRFDRTDLFDKKDYGLVPLTLSVWQGLMFVNRLSDPSDLQANIQGFDALASGFGLNDMQYYRRVEYTVQCNWKVYVDNYLEGYHVPLVHPTLSSALNYREYRTEIHPHYSVQMSPLSDKESSYGVQPGGTAYYVHMFPNFMLNILPGRLQTNLVLPISHRRSLVVFDYYYLDISPSAIPKIEEDIRYSDSVQREDIMICEHVQKGLESGAYDRGRFSVEMESAVHHFQSYLKTSTSRYVPL
jgi:choline monooxygenase